MNCDHSYNYFRYRGYIWVPTSDPTLLSERDLPVRRDLVLEALPPLSFHDLTPGRTE